MRFHATVNVPQTLAAAAIGVLIALGLIGTFGEVTGADAAACIAYVLGQVVCLGVLWCGRDRHPADRSEP